MLSLTSLNDDALGTVLSLCDLSTIASAARTCRRIADLLSNPNQIAWHSHLRRVLLIPEADDGEYQIELAPVNAKTLLRGAMRQPPPGTLNSHHSFYMDLSKFSAFRVRQTKRGQFQATMNNSSSTQQLVGENNCCVRADEPFPTGPSMCTVIYRRQGDRDGHKIALSTLSYFEVEISGQQPTSSRPIELPIPNHHPRTHCVAIGLSTKNYRLYGYQPGWTENSLGYHGDDGCIFHGSGTSGVEFGPKFSLGDVVGCGLHRPTGSVFFTLNGALVGTAFVLRRSDVPLYPVVGLDSSDTVTVNFGSGAPFKFDPERAARLYDVSPPVERCGTRQQATSSLPRGFVCKHPEASSRHPWKPTATTHLIEVNDSSNFRVFETDDIFDDVAIDEDEF